MQFLRKMIAIGLLWVAVLALAGCVITTPTPGAPGEPVATPVSPVETPTQPAEDDAPPVGTIAPAVPAAAIAARDTFAAQMNMLADAFTVVSVEATEWPDGCLGLPVPDEMCTMAIVPGYLVVLEADGTRYELHTDNTGAQVRVAPFPTSKPTSEVPGEESQASGEVVLTWQNQTAQDCRSAEFSAAGVQYGACGTALTQGALNENMARGAQLADMVQTYASFAANTPAGKLTLTGQGPLTATSAEQRMLAEWASQTAREAETASAAAVQGLALVWHREGGIAGFCDDLSLYMTGMAYGTDCRGAVIQSLGSRRLTADELAELYTWVDALASFQVTEKDPATADAMTVGLMLMGQGDREATADERSAMNEFAGQMLLRWADPTPVPSVQTLVDVTIYAGPGETYPVVGEVFAGQTARVTGVSYDSTWWRVVCPDDTLGNCWMTGDSQMTQPNVPPGATGLDPIDETGIYAAVTRQVYTVDHTYGNAAPNFPRIYLLRADDVQSGGDLPTDGPVKGLPIIAAPIQQGIVAAVSDLPAQFTWIKALEDAPRDANGSIEDNGAIITLGNIQTQPDGTIQVAASIYIGMLAAGGQTYVLEKVDDAWQITGKTGAQWIS